MTTQDILNYRLFNQGLVESTFKTPQELVSWMGAVQAQDYPAATWALGLRLPGNTDATIEKAFDEGKILRTHVMRPTWHFVTPADIRWMLKLTAPRVNAVSAYYYRQLGLDDEYFKRSNALLQKSLQGNNYLTRSELSTVLKNAGIDTKQLLRLGYLLIRAELDGVICSGPRKGKQFTYALLEERVPSSAKVLDHDEALATLTKKYFTSHGPATIKDFVWWSGLTVADAKRGLEINKADLVQEVIDDKTYWFAPSEIPLKDISKTGYLLPNYDEYTIAYKDRDAFLNAAQAEMGLDDRGNIMFNHSIVFGGKIVGGWRRTFEKGSIVLTWKAFTPWSVSEKRIFTEAENRFGRFLGMPIIEQEV